METIKELLQNKAIKAVAKITWPIWRLPVIIGFLLYVIFWLVPEIIVDEIICG